MSSQRSVYKPIIHIISIILIHALILSDIAFAFPETKSRTLAAWTRFPQTRTLSQPIDSHYASMLIPGPASTPRPGQAGYEKAAAESAPKDAVPRAGERRDLSSGSAASRADSASRNDASQAPPSKPVATTRLELVREVLARNGVGSRTLKDMGNDLLNRILDIAVGGGSNNQKARDLMAIIPGGFIHEKQARRIITTLENILRNPPVSKRNTEVNIPSRIVMSDKLREAVDRIVKTDFTALKEGVDYDYTEGRNIYLNVVRVSGEPLNVYGRTVKVLKFKGACFDAARKIREFDDTGHYPLEITFGKNGEILSQALRPKKPDGAMTIGGADNEYDITKDAFMAGAKVAVPIGRVIYNDLSFNGNNLGMVILGLEHDDEKSFREILAGLLGEGEGDVAAAGYRIKVYPDKVAANRERIINLFRDTGKALADLHGQKIIHQFPHLGNILVTPKGDVRLGDLETAKKLIEPTLRQEVAYRVSDIRTFSGSLMLQLNVDLLNMLGDRFGIMADVEFMLGYLGDNARAGSFANINFSSLGETLAGMHKDPDYIDSNPLLASIKDLVAEEPPAPPAESAPSAAEPQGPGTAVAKVLTRIPVMRQIYNLFGDETYAVGAAPIIESLFLVLPHILGLELTSLVVGSSMAVFTILHIFNIDRTKFKRAPPKEKAMIILKTLAAPLLLFAITFFSSYQGAHPNAIILTNIVYHFFINMFAIGTEEGIIYAAVVGRKKKRDTDGPDSEPSRVAGASRSDASSTPTETPVMAADRLQDAGRKLAAQETVQNKKSHNLDDPKQSFTFELELVATEQIRKLYRKELQKDRKSLTLEDYDREWLDSFLDGSGNYLPRALWEKYRTRLINLIRQKIPDSWRADVQDCMGRQTNLIEIRTTCNNGYYSNTTSCWQELCEGLRGLQEVLPAGFYSVHLHVGYHSWETNLTNAEQSYRLSRLVKVYEALWRVLAGYGWSAPKTAELELLPEKAVFEDLTNNTKGIINISTQVHTIEIKIITGLLNRHKKLNLATIRDDMQWCFRLLEITHERTERFPLSVLGIPSLAGFKPSPTLINRFLELVFSGDEYGKKLAMRKFKTAARLPASSVKDRESQPETEMKRIYEDIGLGRVYDLHMRHGGFDPDIVNGLMAQIEPLMQDLSRAGWYDGREKTGKMLALFFPKQMHDSMRGWGQASSFPLPEGGTEPLAAIEPVRVSMDGNAGTGLISGLYQLPEEHTPQAPAAPESAPNAAEPRAGKPKSEPPVGPKGLSRRKFLLFGLFSMGSVVSAGQEFKDNEFLTNDEKEEKKIIDLNACYDVSRKTGLLDPALVSPELVWDLHPLQVLVMKRGFHSGRPFEFTDGLIYHGSDNLDEVLLKDKAEGEIFFTRVAHEWAIGSFTKVSRSPAIFVLDTQYFNNLMKTGHAKLLIGTVEGTKFLNPYPKATSFSLEQVKEIWVSEETYDRYKRIINAAKSSDLPVEDRPLMAVQDKLRQFLKIGKIKRIAGLRHTELSQSSKPEMVKSYATVHSIVGNYMNDRNLFQHIPFFKLVGEKSPFEGINKNMLLSQKVSLLQEVRKTSSAKWIVLAIVSAFAAGISWLLIVRGFLSKQPATPSVEIRDSIQLSEAQAPIFSRRGLFIGAAIGAAIVIISAITGFLIGLFRNYLDKKMIPILDFDDQYNKGDGSFGTTPASSESQDSAATETASQPAEPQAGGHIIRGDPLRLYKAFQSAKKRDLRYSIKILEILGKIRERIEFTQLFRDSNPDYLKMHSILSNGSLLQSINYREFDHIVLHSRQTGSRPEGWLLGFNTMKRLGVAAVDEPHSAFLKLLSEGERQSPALYLATKVIDYLISENNHSIINASLLEEYIFHEMFCPLFGHTKCRRIQESLFSENYRALGPDRRMGHKDGRLTLLLKYVIDPMLLSEELRDRVWYWLRGTRGFYDDRNSEIRRTAASLERRLGRKPSIVETAESMPGLAGSPNPKKVLNRWFLDKGLDPKDFGIGKYIGAVTDIVRRDFLWANTRIFLPPHLEGRVRIEREGGSIAEEKTITLVDTKNRLNKIVLENLTDENKIRFTYNRPDGTNTVSIVDNPGRQSSISVYLLSAFEDFYDIAFNIPLESGPARETAIARHLRRYGTAETQDEPLIDFRGRLQLPSFYDTHKRRLRIYRDRKQDARFVVIRERANPANLVGYEWREGEIRPLRGGAALTPNLYIAESGVGGELPLYYLWFEPNFTAFDENIDKICEKKVVTPEQCELENRSLGLARFSFRVKKEVRVISFEGMRAGPGTRDDRERYPLILERIDGAGQVRIGYNDPLLGTEGGFVVDGLTWEDGRQVILWGSYFNLSTIVEMVRRGLLSGVKTSDMLLNTFDYTAGGVDESILMPVRSYRIGHNKSILTESILVHPRTFERWTGRVRAEFVDRGYSRMPESAKAPLPVGIRALSRKEAHDLNPPSTAPFDPKRIEQIRANLTGADSAKDRPSPYGPEFNRMLGSRSSTSLQNTFERAKIYAPQYGISEKALRFLVFAIRLYCSDTPRIDLQMIPAVLAKHKVRDSIANKISEALNRFTNRFYSVADAIPFERLLRSENERDVKESVLRFVGLKNEHLRIIDEFRDEIAAIAPDLEVLQDIVTYFRDRVEAFFDELEQRAVGQGIMVDGGRGPATDIRDDIPRPPVVKNPKDLDNEADKFSNRALFRYIRHALIYYMSLDISHHTTVPDINWLIEKAKRDYKEKDRNELNGEHELGMLEYSEEERAYLLPVLRDGEPVIYYGFSKEDAGNIKGRIIYQEGDIKIYVREKESGQREEFLISGRSEEKNLSEEAKIDAECFKDSMGLIEKKRINKDKEGKIGKEEQVPIYLLLGTSSIPHFGDTRQANRLDPLITAMRRRCEEAGIVLIDKEDENLQGEIERIREENPNAKIITLAGANTVKRMAEGTLGQNENVFLSAFDFPKDFPLNSYIALVRMLDIALNTYLRKDTNINEYLERMVEEHPELGIRVIGGLLTFFPKPVPVDNDRELNKLYRLQISA